MRYSPPEYALTDDEWRYQPYLIEYPENVLRDKVAFMTDLLENAFQRKMTSHRAGAGHLMKCTPAPLIDQGYLVDCSVTPRVSWRNAQGAPQDRAERITAISLIALISSMNRIFRPGGSPLLELPMSIQYRYGAFTNQLKNVEWHPRQAARTVSELAAAGGRQSGPDEAGGRTDAQSG